jgi:hypothetical protein
MNINFDLSNGREGKFMHLLALYGSLNEVYLCVMNRQATEERGFAEMFKNKQY